MCHRSDQSTAAVDGITLAHPIEGLTALRHFRQRVGGLQEANAPGNDVPLSDLSLYRSMDDSKYPALDDTGGGGTGSEEIDFELVEVSRWGTGYCADGFVTNNSDTDVTWEVSDTIEGAISSIWNANKRESGGLTYFTGVSWNGTLAPEHPRPLDFARTSSEQTYSNGFIGCSVLWCCRGYRTVYPHPEFTCLSSEPFGSSGTVGRNGGRVSDSLYHGGSR